MNPFTSETLRMILLFFVPGFISMKIYDLYFPSARRDFSKSILEAVSFSLFNFAILYWAIVNINTDDFGIQHPILYYIFFFLIVFVAPILWTQLYRKFLSTQFMRNRIIHPVDKPWDYVFGQKQAYWVIAHLKDGRKIGGRYDTRSFASSYPAPEQIYLEEVWYLDETGKFIYKIDRTKGIIISASEFLSIELFQ